MKTWTLSRATSKEADSVQLRSNSIISFFFSWHLLYFYSLLFSLRLPGRGEAIKAIDVTSDGKLVVCTTETILSVFSTQVPSLGTQASYSGFDKVLFLFLSFTWILGPFNLYYFYRQWENISLNSSFSILTSKTLRELEKFTLLLPNLILEETQAKGQL